MVTIEDTLLRTMASDERFLTEFPFLRELKPQAKKVGCGRCGKKKTSSDEPVLLNAARSQISAMSQDKKRKLLQLLNAEQARIRYSDGGKSYVKTIDGRPA